MRWSEAPNRGGTRAPSPPPGRPAADPFVCGPVPAGAGLGAYRDLAERVVPDVEEPADTAVPEEEPVDFSQPEPDEEGLSAGTDLPEEE